MRHLELGRGQVRQLPDGVTSLQLPALPLSKKVLGSQHEPQAWSQRASPLAATYSDAQIDDYGGLSRRNYPWQNGVSLTLQAKFSQEFPVLQGTAGFGFWNAPFGDPTVKMPALPQAVWFFYGSPPTDLPLAPESPGRGWFAATIDAGNIKALSLIPIAPLVLITNQFTILRQRIWPFVQQRLGITFQPLPVEMTKWHHYRLDWRRAGCDFWVDEQLILQTNVSPCGPLGFVCWLDNQYLTATARGRVNAGILPINTPQWLKIKNLKIHQL